MNSTYVQLKKNLEYLKLNQMDLHLDEVIDLITSSPLSFTEGLCKLTNYEIDFKEANMIRSMVKVGAFPHQKGISDFDFEFQPSVNPEEIKDFATLRFLENAENIVFLGPSGVGKTHLATAIGVCIFLCAINAGWYFIIPFFILAPFHTFSFSLSYSLSLISR